jgi:hypothetical protein
LASQPRELAGYGGDIAATASGFVLSTPRAGGLTQWSATGQWQGFVALEEACPLAAEGAHWWAGGRQQLLSANAPSSTAATNLPPLRLDNHWTRWGVSLPS